MRIHQEIASPPILSEDWYKRWEDTDQGLICCWLRGIEKSREDNALADKAKAGELPVLAWKGGVEKSIKMKTKVGALTYLATWQGLRGEDLDIDTDLEVSLTCSRTGVLVLFTNQIHKILQPEASEN